MYSLPFLLSASGFNFCAMILSASWTPSCWPVLSAFVSFVLNLLSSSILPILSINLLIHSLCSINRLRSDSSAWVIESFESNNFL